MLKRGNSILIKQEHDSCFLKKDLIYKVMGFNYYLGEKTYRLQTRLEDELWEETHCLVKNVDDLISKGYFIKTK